MAKKKDNGLFGDGDSKALAAAVAKHTETEYAKAKRVTTATTRRGLSGDFSGNKTKSQRTAYSQRRSNIDVPELSTPKSSVKANTTTTRNTDLSSISDDTLISDLHELNKALGWRSRGMDYMSAGARSDLTRGNNVAVQYLSELKKRGYDTTELDKEQSDFGSYLKDYTSFFSQFKDEDDFNERFKYPNKYANSKGKDIESAITELTGGSNVDLSELSWLKRNRYSYYTTDELKSLAKQLKSQIEKSENDDRALARQGAGILGADSDATSALKARLTAVQNALRDSAYADETEKWDEGYRKYFYSSYGKDLNTVANDLQGSSVSAAAAVSGELSNARKAVQRMDKYLRSKGYSDEEISSLKAYAQSQNNAKKAYENAAYWQSVADSGFWGKVGASVASVPANLLSGMAFADRVLQKLTNPADAFTGEQRALDYNNSPLAYSGENMRAAVSRNMSDVGSFLYGTGMSIADFLAAGGASKATGMVGKVFKAANTADNAADAARGLTTLQRLTNGMGNSAELMLSGAAANSAMRSAKERGASDAEALGFGFLNGAAEMFGEHASIENLKRVAKAIGDAASNRTVRNAIKQTLLQSGVEASEEALTSVANTISDLVVMGDRSEYASTLQSYLEQGESENDAQKHAMLDWLGQVALDAAAGALSGGVTAGVTIGSQTASAKVRETLVGWEEKSTLQYLNTIATACEYAEGSKTRKLAEELAARLDGKSSLTGAEIKNSEIGKLTKLMLEEREQAPQKAQESMSNPAEAFRPAGVATENAQEPQTSETESENSANEPAVVNATAQAFEAQGIETTDALARAEVVDRLLSGDTVSNRELERIGSLKDMEGVTAFAELTGKPIPQNLTAAKLRRYFRETAAEIVEQRKSDATTVLSTELAQQRGLEDAQALEAESAVSEAFKPNNVDNTGGIGYTGISNNSQEGTVNAGTQSGVQAADARDSGATLDGDGGAGARLDGLSGGYLSDRGLSERAENDGRGDTELPKVVRLSAEDNKSIENSGSASVELDDFTNEPAAFSSALDKARNADARNGWAVTPQSADSLAERGVKLLMKADGATGLGVAPDGDIIGVFKNPNSHVIGALRTLIPTAIANGGTKLDCYGYNLVRQYQKYGFIPVARTKFVAEFANEGWTPDKGEPDIYFMMHNGDSAEVTLRKSIDDSYEKYSKEYCDSLPLMDYEDAEKYRDGLLKQRQQRFSFEGKTAKLADGTELTYDEFAAQVRKAVPDITDDAIQSAFAEELENDTPLPTAEAITEGRTETVIQPEAAREIAQSTAVHEHVRVDDDVKLSRGQRWLVNFIATTLRSKGVVTDVVISGKYGDAANGAMSNGTLTLSPKLLDTSTAGTRRLLNRTIGHELCHGTIDKTEKSNGKRSTALVDETLEALQKLDPSFNLDALVERKRALYRAEYAKQVNPNTGKPYTELELDLKTSDPEMREEIAADRLGEVFDAQNELVEMSGINPGIIVRAYKAVSEMSERIRNGSAEAKASRTYLREQQARFRAAMQLAANYNTESGTTEMRNSVSDKPWDKQVEMALIANGLKNVDGYTAENYADVRKEIGDSMLCIKDVPTILQEVGLENKPLAYTQLHMINAVLPIERDANGHKTNSSWHGVDDATLTELPELLGKPVMVLKSRQQDSSTGALSDSLMVVVDAYDSENNPVVVIIKPNGEAVIDGKKTRANFITSIYGNENIFVEGETSYLKWASENDGILYVNSALTDKMLRKIGQKKSAAPINSPEDTSEEYAATDSHTAAAGIFPLTRQAVQSRTVSSATNTVSQNERLVKSRFKALAANPYLQNVELDTVLSEDITTAPTDTKLPESVMRSGYKSGGELISWVRNEDGTYSADETASEARYLNMTSPLLIECDGRDISRLGEVSDGRGDTVEAVRDAVYADELVYDGIVLRNLSDDTGTVRDVAIPLTDAQVIPRFSFEDRQYAPTFYSKLERVVESQKQEKLGAASVVNMLKGKGVKAEEIKWSGIEAFLDGKKSVTKTELLDFLRENQLQIDTVQLGGKAPDKPIVEFYDEYGQVIRNPFWGQRVDVVDTQTGEVYATVEPNFDEGYMINVDTGEEYWGESELRDALGVTTVNAEEDPEDGTHWSKYTLNGGENYRELLYTMPDSTYSNQAMKVHWGRSGVLAHARVQDFVNAEGKSVLFIEEIQSDWHNAGQKEGYNDPVETEAEYKRLQKRVLDADAELDTDPELAEIVRKLMVLRGYNNPEYAKNFLASTTGLSNAFVEAVFSSADPAARAQMYDSTIVANTDEEIPQLTLEGQRQVLADADVVRAWQRRWTDANVELREYKWAMERGLTPDAPFRNSYTDFVLKNLIRDAAEQGYDMIAWTTAAQQEARWSSEFAEGYRIEYDQDIPSFLKKYGKQWGAKVGYTLIGLDLTDTSAYRDGGMDAVMTIAANTADETGRLSNGMYIVHSMDVTDAMRESVLYDGQPRFSLKDSSENVTPDDATAQLFSERNAIRLSVTPGLTLDQWVQRTADRWKASKVRTNTFRNSGFFTRTELQMEGLTEKDLGYEPISEQESMARARQRLESDYVGTRDDLLNSEGVWKGESLDAAMGIFANEIANARETGNYSEVIKWAQRIRERGTEAGQMVQAFAKYTRTPEGALVEATRDLDNALRDGQIDQRQRDDLLKRLSKFTETLDAIQADDKNALIDLIVKQAQQRNTPVSDKTMAAMRADTTQFQFLYDTALAQFSQIAKDYVKTSFGRKVATFQTLSHLLNARTALRNLGSNNIFTLVDTVASDVAMLPDLLMSTITGKRTVGLDRSRLSAAAREGAQEARNRSRIEVALDVAPATAKDKYGTSRRTFKMAGGKFDQAMSTAEKALGFELNYTDESAKGAIRAQVMQSLKPYVDDGTLTEVEAQQFAEDEALYRTFQDDTAVSTILGEVKKALNVVGFGDGKPLVAGRALKTHDFGLGDIVVKYTQVPGALFTRAYEFSPLGYAKAVVNLHDMFKARQELNSRTDLSDKQRAELQTEQNKAQRRAALFMGRATTGTGLIAFFASMAAAGLLSRGDDEDDPDAKALRAAMGVSGTQLNMSALGRWIAGGSTKWQEGDALASLDFLEPLNSLMAMGTLVAKSDEGVSVGKIAAQSLPVLFNAFSELSVMQTLGTIVDTATYYTPESGVGLDNEDIDKIATVGLNVALSGVTGFVPAPVRQTAQALDSSNRDAYGERGLWAKTAAQLKNTIPFLRETLPEKQTGFGEPKPTEDALLRAVNAFAMPGMISTYKPSNAADELAEVYNATDIANIYPDRNAPYKVSQGSGRDKVDYQLTADERETYLRTRGQLSKQLIEAAQASDAYQAADEFTRADMLIEAKNYANYVAKKNFFETRGIDFNTNATYENYGDMLKSGVDLSSYLAFNASNNALEADLDEDGDAISGTKKAKTLDLIAEQSLSTEQKEALYFKAYPNERSDYDALDIGFDSYLTYSRAMCTMTGDKDANGKTISGSKKEKVVRLISSLDISDEAKTRLYLSNGYSSRTMPGW